MLDGIFASLYSTSVTVPVFLTVCLLSVALGFGIAQVYRKISGEGGTMVSALTVLPFLVQLVILLVNGNLGAGVAVAGAFSLVRFRSAPGSARDIMAIFLAMTVGLCCGSRDLRPSAAARGAGSGCPRAGHSRDRSGKFGLQHPLFRPLCRAYHNF